MISAVGSVARAKRSSRIARTPSAWKRSSSASEMSSSTRTTARQRGPSCAARRASGCCRCRSRSAGRAPSARCRASRQAQVLVERRVRKRVQRLARRTGSPARTRGNVRRSCRREPRTRPRVAFGRAHGRGLEGLGRLRSGSRACACRRRRADRCPCRSAAAGRRRADSDSRPTVADAAEHQQLAVAPAGFGDRRDGVADGRVVDVPGTPSSAVRSFAPMASMSTPSMRAISSAFATPAGVSTSICTIVARRAPGSSRSRAWAACPAAAPWRAATADRGAGSGRRGRSSAPPRPSRHAVRRCRARRSRAVGRSLP